jgi:hypothetical protein
MKRMGIAERLAWLCQQGHGDELDELAAEAGAGPLVARIRSAVAAGGADLREQELGALDEALAGAGLESVTVPQSERGYRPLPAAPGHPVVHAWVCPKRACARAEPDDAASPAPWCQLGGLALERVRLPT